MVICSKKYPRLNNRKGYNLSAGMDYTIDDRQSLSVDGRAFINRRNDELQSTTGIYDASDLSVGEILKPRHWTKSHRNYTLNVNYRYVFNQSSNISTDISYGRLFE